MRIAFLLVVIFHGLIHLLGFLKSFEIIEVKGLTSPISKPLGIFWGIVAVLFLIYAIMRFFENGYVWIIGFIAVGLSQVLIFLFWSDAKFGTIPNMLILIVTLIGFGAYHFQKLVQQETSELISQVRIPAEELISENDIEELPEPVKNWLRRSGMIGKQRISVGKVTQQAEMKMKADQQNWMSASALQYSVTDHPAFIWTTRVKMNSLLYFHGRDKFEEGKGEMLIRLNSLFNVVNEKGNKMDEGSIQRYLGEMVWFPSLALNPHISWEPIDERTARATMDYKGTRGSGTFYFNEEGDFVRFSALRFMGNAKDAKRYEWVLSVTGYKVFEGIRVPAEMTATWKLEDGDWTWLKLTISDIAYNANALP